MKRLSRALENAIVGSAYPAVTNPAWKDYKSAVRKYADKSKVELESNNEQSAWVSMMVFWKVAKTIKGKITAARLTAALNKTKKLSTGGLTPLLNYTKPFGVPSLARCADRWVWRLKVQKGKIVQIGKDTPADISGLLIRTTS